jgi:hypothetical protein
MYPPTDGCVVQLSEQPPPYERRKHVAGGRPDLVPAWIVRLGSEAAVFSTCFMMFSRCQARCLADRILPCGAPRFIWTYQTRVL